MAFVMLMASSVVWAQQPAPLPRLLETSERSVRVDPEALERQYAALLTVAAETIEYSNRGLVSSLQGVTGLSLPTSARYLPKGSEASDKILPLVGDFLLAKGNESLVVQKNSLIDASTRALRLTQSIRGIPVINGILAIDYDDATMRVSGITADFIPDRDLPTTPKLSSQEAEQSVPEALQHSKELRGVQIEIINGTHLAYYADPAYPTPAQLVWVVEAALGTRHELFFVNAITGVIAGRQQLTHAVSRTVHNANGGTLSIPGGLSNGNKLSPPSFGGIQDAIDVYSHVADADVTVLSRLPYVAADMPTSVKIVVRQIHQDPDPSYTATHKLAGGTDYLTFSPATTGLNAWTKPRDIAVHEYAHGIGKRTMNFADTTLDNQVGALHEFFSDLVAMVVDVSYRGVAAHHSWRIAEGLWTGNSAWALRSHKSPAFDLQSAIHGNWFPLRSLWGNNNAAYNATIAGHAYYLSIFGGMNEEAGAPHIPMLNVPPLSTSATTAEARARQIFMRALQDNTMASGPTFKKLKTAAMAQALSLYGASARTSVMTAFNAVGVCHTESAPPSTSPEVNLIDFMCAGRFITTWPSMPNVSRYYAEVAPAAFGFALATPVTDINGGPNQCNFQVTRDSIYRMRACNSCGCGPWSDTEYLEFWSPCP